MVSFSVIIVTHGREELLIKCLDSLRSEFANWELIIVANGLDLSQEVLSKAEALTTHFTLLTSDVLMTPGKARNTAIESAQGEWVFFLDDDSYLLPGYWDLVLPLMRDEKVEVFGGPDSPAKNMNMTSLSLALALSSPFCTGSTFGRHKSFGNKLLLVDEDKLTSCNLWVRRKLLQEVKFPEDYKRAEETLLLHKLKAQGHDFYYHPKLKVAHFRRSKILQLIRPTFFAGFYRSKVLKEKLRPKSEIFWLPAFFVMLHCLIFFEPEVFWYLARMYASIILLVSLSLAMRVKKIVLFPMIAFLHYFIVFIYGIGFICERIWRVRG